MSYFASNVGAFITNDFLRVVVRNKRKIAKPVFPCFRINPIRDISYVADMQATGSCRNVFTLQVWIERIVVA